MLVTLYPNRQQYIFRYRRLQAVKCFNRLLLLNTYGDITLYNKKEWLRGYSEKKVKLIGVAEYVQKTLEVLQ